MKYIVLGLGVFNIFLGVMKFIVGIRTLSDGTMAFSVLLIVSGITAFATFIILNEVEKYN